MLADVIVKPTSNISAAVRNRLPIQQHQHAFQIGQPVALSAPVEPKSSPVVFHEIINDNLFAKVTGIVTFIVLAQAFKNVDNPAFKHRRFTVMQLLEGAQDIFF